MSLFFFPPFFGHDFFLHSQPLHRSRTPRCDMGQPESKPIRDEGTFYSLSTAAGLTSLRLIKIRIAASYAITAGLIILWAFPVAAIGALSNLAAICQRYAFLAWVCALPPSVVGLLQVCFLGNLNMCSLTWLEILGCTAPRSPCGFDDATPDYFEAFGKV